MKRAFSPASELGPLKKAKTVTETNNESERHIADIQDRRPPEQLQMSILRWEGWPAVLTPEDSHLHGEIGTYESAASDSDLVLNLRSWNEDTKQAQYVPEHGPVIFHYKRRAWVGPVGDGCGIVGDSMPVKIQVCRLGENPWPQVLMPMMVLRRMEEEGDDYNPAQDKDLGPERTSKIGPPFHFHLCDFVSSHEEDEEEGGCENPIELGENIFQFIGPDLPGQHRQGPNGIAGAFLEKGRGWQGPYVRKLLKKKKREQPLGERPIKTQWTYNRQWAIDVGFKALDVYLAEKDEDGNEDGEAEDEYEYDDEGPALDGYKELQEPGDGDDSQSSSSSS